MIKVKSLDHIEFGVPRIDEVTYFYEEKWGLQLFDQEPSGEIRYMRTQDSGHHAVSLRSSEVLSLDHLAFEVANPEDLEIALAEAELAGGSMEKMPGDAVEPGHKRSARLKDPDGNSVELIWSPDKVSDKYRTSLVAPRKIGHVVLNTPQPEILEGFYRQLGFRVSDRTAQGMSFLRCNSDHHSLALNRSSRTGVQHVAYDVVEMDNVMKALGSLTKSGSRCIWGPGRHGPGNNIFTYYSDPAGLIIEYYAELEQVSEPDEDIEVRFWGPEWKGDLWGTAGPPPDVFRN